ncbi:meiotic recombination protein REC8 homolog [Liolophura sinensis]|uniref:meiotic recombination protein REC8 homolog n=1 Tax=Liolophura sinensis TaxID=3198878 RepID=UPI0031583CE9
MFYSQDILQKRGGRFGIIWLAATNFKRLTRREFCSVNVNKTSDDILDYILLRALPSRPGAARPRLSLYLASQLMFGLTKVYGKQREYLLSDVTAMSTRFHMILAPVADIDLRVTPRADLVTNPDYAAQSSRYGPAFDPYFGVFGVEDTPDTDIIPELKMWESQVISPQSELSPSIHLSRKPAAVSPPHTVSSSEITMMEEIMSEPAARELTVEEDLPILSDEQLETLMHQVGLEDPLLRVTSPSQAVSTPIQHPSLTGTSKRDLLPPLEETPIAGVHVSLLQPTMIRQARPPSPGITPRVPSPDTRRRKRKRSSLALELSPTATPSPRRARHKRRLPFIDRDTQIPKAVMRENLNSSETTCRPFELPEIGSVPLTDVFKRPGRKALRSSSLSYLWSRNAYPTEFMETSSDIDHPIWTVPDLSVERSSTSEEEQRQAVVDVTVTESAEMTRIQDVTGQSIEILREASLTLERSRQLDNTSLSLDRDIHERSAGEEQLPRKRPKVSVGTSSGDEMADLQVDQSDGDLSDHSRHVGKQLYVLPEVLEEEVQMPAMETMREMPSTQVEEELISAVSRQTASEVYTTFQDICPPSSTSRLTAAKTFSKILEFCASSRLKCYQAESYGDIYVAQGSEW